MLKKWYFWATHSRLGPIKTVAKMIKSHWDGILSWFTSRISNGILEGINFVIQAAKAKSRGFKSFQCFRIMVYLLTGDFDYSKINKHYVPVK
jgi:transposase